MMWWNQDKPVLSALPAWLSWKLVSKILGGGGRKVHTRGGWARTVIPEEVCAARPCSCSWNKNEGKRTKCKSHRLTFIEENRNRWLLLWGQRTFYKFHISGNVRVVCKQNCRKKDQVKNPPLPPKRKVKICHETMMTTISRSVGCRVKERKAEDTNSGFLTFDYSANNKSSQAIKFGIISIIIISTVTFNFRLKTVY